MPYSTTAAQSSVKLLRLVGLKIPLSGSLNSPNRVSKFPSIGLKNPLAKGIRNSSWGETLFVKVILRDYCAIMAR